MLTLSFPLTLQQAVSQIITTIALGIFTVTDTSFKGEAKFLSDSLTLKVVTKARQFYLVKSQFFKSYINQGTRRFGYIASAPIVWVQGIANFQYIVFVAMVEINRANDFISPFDHNAVTSWEIVLFIALRKNMF